MNIKIVDAGDCAFCKIAAHQARTVGSGVGVLQAGLITTFILGATMQRATLEVCEMCQRVLAASTTKHNAQVEDIRRRGGTV